MEFRFIVVAFEGCDAEYCDGVKTYEIEVDAVDEDDGREEEAWSLAEERLTELWQEECWSDNSFCHVRMVLTVGADRKYQSPPEMDEEREFDYLKKRLQDTQRERDEFKRKLAESTGGTDRVIETLIEEYKAAGFEVGPDDDLRNPTAVANMVYAIKRKAADGGLVIDPLRP